MPIEVTCTSCNARMRVPDTAAGKKVRCPKCQQGIISVPAAASGDAPTMFAPTSPVKAQQKLSASGPVATPKNTVAKVKVENWSMQTDDGQTYGPVPKSELDQWHKEGRVTAECQLLKEGADQWQWASEVYPDLAAEGSGATAAPHGAAEGGGGDPMFDFLGGGGGEAGGGHGAAAPAGGGLDFGDPAATPYAAPATTSSTTTKKGVKGKGKGKSKGRSAEEGDVGKRSKVAAGLLGVLLGGWGAHNFYLGFTQKACIQIGVTMITCGFGALWGIIEGIMIFTGSINRDADGLLLKD